MCSCFKAIALTHFCCSVIYDNFQIAGIDVINFQYDIYMTMNYIELIKYAAVLRT